MEKIKENIFEVIKNFDNCTTDQIGVVYANIYKDFPIYYKLYLDDDGKLCSHPNTLAFGNILKNLKKKINMRKLLVELVNNGEDYGVKVFNYSENESLIIGLKDDLRFVVNFVVGSECDDISIQYLDVFSCKECIENVVRVLSHFTEESHKVEKYTFGIATCATSSIYTSWYDFEDKRIDVEKNYNDDFKEPYEKICNMIEQKGKTGLALLYGEPGTGKSSVIKHLIAKYSNKDFIFIDDSILMSAAQDKLMSYFLENNDTVFVLEDCEKVLMSRDISNNPLINTILNITDGIMGDVLGVKLICTFNTSLNRIDKALLRKGRMNVKYEFKKLSKEKASQIIGREVDEDMTLAEIYNIDDENDYSKDEGPKRKIGYTN